VKVPVTGAEGFTGWALITTLADAGEAQPDKVEVTVKV
jgi:nucleoside-diphosphate-sugar epimerase